MNTSTEPLSFGESNMTIELANLGQFTGTQQYFQSNAFTDKIIHTEGVQYLAQNGAGWLIDAIVSHYITNGKIRKEEFLAIKLEVSGSSAILRFEDGNDNLIAKQVIGFTDFPEPGVTLYMTDNVILLPSEY